MPITIIPSKEYWYDVGVQLGIQQERARAEKEKLETIRKLIDAGLEEDILLTIVSQEDFLVAKQLIQ